VKKKAASRRWLMACLAMTLPLLVSCHQERRQVNIYNWADFIGSNTVTEFERRTGIKVVYDTYDSEETAETRLMAGGSDYDVVVSSSEFFSRSIKAGVYEPLDKHLLPNWKNLDPHALEILSQADPDNAHAIPYLHSINGFAYNVDEIHERMPDAPVDSLDMIFDPKIIARFADCGVTFLDSPADMLPLALNYLHLDPNSTRPADYAAAEQLLKRVRPYVRTFDSSAYLNGLANAEQCIGVGWSSDYAVSMARAREAGIKVNLAFTVPREGANRSYSALLVPAGAPHRREAYAFLNYLLEPKVIAEVTNEIYYGNDNAAARSYVRKEILDDGTLYPDAAMDARLYPGNEATPELDRLRTRTWTRIKTNH
jgi:putrescine transport system substrate-binding protein